MFIIFLKKYCIYDLEYVEKIDFGQFDGIVIMRIQEGIVVVDGGREIVECFGEFRLYSLNVCIYIVDEKYFCFFLVIKVFVILVVKFG